MSAPDRSQERERFASGLAACYALYGKDLTTGMLEIWWRALASYPVADVLRALTDHARNPDSGQWPPKPADVVRVLAGSTETQAMRAWTDVERAIRSVGPWRSVAFDDPVTMRVLDDMGGWIELCRITDADLPFRAREFGVRYRGYAAQSTEPTAPPRLPGLVERTNAQLSAPPPAPARIASRHDVGAIAHAPHAPTNPAPLPAEGATP